MSDIRHLMHLVSVLCPLELVLWPLGKVLWPQGSVLCPLGLVLWPLRFVLCPKAKAHWLKMVDCYLMADHACEYL